MSVIPSGEKLPIAFATTHNITSSQKYSFNPWPREENRKRTLGKTQPVLLTTKGHYLYKKIIRDYIIKISHAHAKYR